MKGPAKSCLLGHKMKEALKVSIESYTPAVEACPSMAHEPCVYLLTKDDMKWM